VRVLYVSRALGYRAQHDVAITAPDRATVASRFAIATPAWHARATVTIFAGVPGTEHPPRELTRGPVMLDGATAVLAVAPRTLPAELRWIYDGALSGPDDSSPRDRAWHRASHPAVWVWLELHDAPAGGLLASAAAHVHVELPGEPVRDVDVPAAAQRRATTGLGLPLWIDPQLHGRRDRVTSSPEDGALSDSFSLSVANTGPVAREVWIEEQLRPTRRHAVVRAWPGAPALIQHLLRLKLAVPPGKLERAGFEIHYDL
jgi:hypothetical protein